MEAKVEKYITRYHLIEQGDRIVVGVSGGADSVCLLFLLSKLCTEWNLSLHCVHINHMIRETASRDEQYVESLCKQWEVPFTCEHIDVEELARRERLSVEEAGRKARYETFERILQEVGADKIAIAHNRNDCAETMLFQLFRGSQIRGIGGIRPRNGRIIRPLLGVKREEIEEFLCENKIEWQQDETNETNDYSRNRIRHIILPEAEKLCPNVVERMGETASGLWETEDYLESQTKIAWEECALSQENGSIEIRKDRLELLHPVIQKRLLYRALVELAGKKKDICNVHVIAALSLLKQQVGHKRMLPYEVEVIRSYEGLKFEKANDEAENADKALEIPLMTEEKNLLNYCDVDGFGRIRLRCFVYEKLENIPQKTYTKWLDYDKIVNRLVLRKRQEGDFLVISDRGERKSLKSYFINEKIPVRERDRLWLVADGKEIVWIIGLRIGARYKVSDQTRTIVEIHVEGQEA